MANGIGKQCECSDPGCPVHKDASACVRRAVSTLYRVDMIDETGTKFCEECGSDAMDSGLFSEESPAVRC